MTRSLIYENGLSALLGAKAGAGAAERSPLEGNLVIRAKSAEVSEWRGGQALRLEDGLVMVSGISLESGSVEVEIAVDQGAYPGIAFHIADPLNFELAYSQPHTSGSWDALQYDPVFHGSNTWQIHSGPKFQKDAVVPTGTWYSMRLEFAGDSAALSVDGQPPLVVTGLAHGRRSGPVGIWTFRPAYFRNLKVYAGYPGRLAADCARTAMPSSGPDRTAVETAQEQPQDPQDACSGFRPQQNITEWVLGGIGVVTAESNGLVLLNRFLPSHLTEAVLTRKFELANDSRVEFRYGYSDVFSLAVDDVTIFSGSNTFSGVGDRDARGYVEPEAHIMAWDLKAGIHTIKATVGVKEPFGWGFGVSISGSEGITLLAAWMG